MSDKPKGRVSSSLARDQRLRLEALRYAVNEEAASYLAIMRCFTGDISGLLSDQSAAEVAERLAELSFDLDVDTVDARLSYLVEHGNLARSPRETEARSLREYLTNRARYQFTQRRELVHRMVEELLDHAEAVTEVSSEMLGGILQGLRTRSRTPTPAWRAPTPMRSRVRSARSSPSSSAWSTPPAISTPIWLKCSSAMTSSKRSSRLSRRHC